MAEPPILCLYMGTLPGVPSEYSVCFLADFPKLWVFFNRISRSILQSTYYMIILNIPLNLQDRIQKYFLEFHTIFNMAVSHVWAHFYSSNIFSETRIPSCKLDKASGCFWCSTSGCVCEVQLVCPMIRDDWL